MMTETGDTFIPTGENLRFLRRLRAMRRPNPRATSHSLSVHEKYLFKNTKIRKCRLAHTRLGGI
jgi:hypothetical protein